MKSNMLILSASNAFENRFIFGPLFKRMGAGSPDPRGKLTTVSKSTENLDELAKASRTEYKYKTWVGKKLDWKNSNAREPLDQKNSIKSIKSLIFFNNFTIKKYIS